MFFLSLAISKIRSRLRSTKISLIFNPFLEKPEPPKETKQPEKPVKKLIVEVEKEPLKTLEYVINDKNELYMTISIRIGTVFHFLFFPKSDQSGKN